MVKRGIQYGVEWVHAHANGLRGVVFVPPLIGGEAVQQVKLLRQLLRVGLDIISFNYAGHGRSRGSFSLQTASENCRRILDLATAHSLKQNVPLYGLASCYAAIPLLQAAGIRGEPLQKLVLINAIPSWRLGRIAGHFFHYWCQSGNWRRSLLDLPNVMRAYRDELLPGVAHHPHAFGILARQRVQWIRLGSEILSQKPLPPASVPHTPVICIYGRNDRVLHQLGFHKWQIYESLIQSICPYVRFLPLEGGHFLTGPDLRDRLMTVVTDFFNWTDGKAITHREATFAVR